MVRLSRTEKVKWKEQDSSDSLSVESGLRSGMTGQDSAAQSSTTHQDGTTASATIIGPDGKIRMRTAVFKPYTGDLFGAFDNSGGMLYLSRIHYGMSPAKKFIMVPPDIVRAKTVPGVEETKKVKEGPVPGTVYKDPHSLERKRRFATSLSTLASKPEKRKVSSDMRQYVLSCSKAAVMYNGRIGESIVEEGAILVLMRLANLRDKVTVASCGQYPALGAALYVRELTPAPPSYITTHKQAFYQLALDAALRERIIESDAVPTIITLLGSPNRKVKMDCAQALCNLAACTGYEGRLVQDGIVPALMSLSTVTIELMMIAIMTLHNLSCVSERYPRIEDVDEAALQYTTYSLSTEMELLLLKCLCNLTGLKGNQTRLIEEGLVQQVHTISKSTTLEGKVLCAKIISNLGTCTRSRGKMVDHKVVFLLLDFLKLGNTEIEQQCALTITRLAADQGCREKLIQHGAVKAVLEMSLRPNLLVETCRACAAALRTFTTDRDIARRVVEGGGIRALINLISDVDDLTTKQDCTRSLCSLFHYEDIVPRLIKEGAVLAVVKMANPRDVISSSCCASALYALSWHPLCSKDVANHTVIQALNELCESDALETRKRCVATLWSLTLQSGKSEDPAVSIPALLNLLRKESDGDMTRLCSAALCNMAVDMDNCQRMLNEGAVAPIINLCSSDNISTRIQCGAILCRLASESSNRDELISVDYLRVLLGLLNIEDPSTQQRSIIALVHISRDPEARQVLLSQNAPSILVQLSNKPDELLRRGCAAVLCNLAYETKSEAVIVNSGAVSCLLIIALVATDNETTKTTCTKAVFNLLSDKAMHRHMIEDGIVWGFSSLSRTPNVSVGRICATVFCNLSIDFPHDVLSSSASTRAIFDLMGSPDPETQLLATQSLANLLSSSGHGHKSHSDAHNKFKPSAVPVIMETLQNPCTGTKVALLASRCLAYISATPAGRAAIHLHDAVRCVNFDLSMSSAEAAADYATTVANMCVNKDSRARAVATGCLNGLVVLSAQAPPDDIISTCGIRALYALSCEPAHLLSLTQAGAIAASWAFLERTSPEAVTDELRLLSAAMVFNLTTSEPLFAELTSQGAVRFMRSFLWEDGSQETRELCLLACCQLGCGQVNSSRLVHDGIGPILIAFADPSHGGELSRRVSTAVRNLLLVNGNHEIMVSDGVVPAIVKLFSAEDFPTKQHCAAALRNITYNNRFRGLLIESKAISVIIEDSKMQDDEDEDDLPMTLNLLFEIEAESWSNGSRGRQREGRAQAMSPLPLRTAHLDRCDCKSFVKPTHIRAAWYKVQAEPAVWPEPPFDLTAEFTPSSFSGSINTRFSRDHDIDFKTHIMLDGKVECPYSGMCAPPSPRQVSEAGLPRKCSSASNNMSAAAADAAPRKSSSAGAAPVSATLAAESAAANRAQPDPPCSTSITATIITGEHGSTSSSEGMTATQRSKRRSSRLPEALPLLLPNANGMSDTGPPIVNANAPNTALSANLLHTMVLDPSPSDNVLTAGATGLLTTLQLGSILTKHSPPPHITMSVSDRNSEEDVVGPLVKTGPSKEQGLSSNNLAAKMRGVSVVNHARNREIDHLVKVVTALKSVDQMLKMVRRGRARRASLAVGRSAAETDQVLKSGHPSRRRRSSQESIGVFTTDSSGASAAQSSMTPPRDYAASLNKLATGQFVIQHRSDRPCSKTCRSVYS